MIHTKDISNGLVVVSAKEHGKLYTLQNGSIELIEHIEEHPPEYSDNEGFFVRSGEGERYGSGNPREEDDQRNLDRYISAIASELSQVVKEKEPSHILLIEPEHLKGQIEENLINPNHIPVHVVIHGNYVQHTPTEILALIEEKLDTTIDPSDPASVAGEENAEEKRKILETAELRHPNQ